MYILFLNSLEHFTAMVLELQSQKCDGPPESNILLLSRTVPVAM